MTLQAATERHAPHKQRPESAVRLDLRVHVAGRAFIAVFTGWLRTSFGACVCTSLGAGTGTVCRASSSAGRCSLEQVGERSAPIRGWGIALDDELIGVGRWNSPSLNKRRRIERSEHKKRRLSRELHVAGAKLITSKSRKVQLRRLGMRRK